MWRRAVWPGIDAPASRMIHEPVTMSWEPLRRLCRLAGKNGEVMPHLAVSEPIAPDTQTRQDGVLRDDVNPADDRAGLH